VSAAETSLISQLAGRKALHIENIITVDTAVQRPITDMVHVVSSGTHIGADKEWYIGYATLRSALGRVTGAAISALPIIEGFRKFFENEVDYAFGSFSYDNSVFVGAPAPLPYNVSKNLTSYSTGLVALGALKFFPLVERDTEEEEILPAPKTDLARLLLRHRESVRMEGGKFRDVAGILAELDANRKRTTVL